MGRVCTADRCKAGYKIRPNDSKALQEIKKLTVYKFPDLATDEKRFYAWKKAINRANFDPALLKHHGVCIRHFEPYFLTTEPLPSQKKSRNDPDRKLPVPRLLDTAYPTLHLGYEVPPPSPRAVTGSVVVSERGRKRDAALAEIAAANEAAAKVPCPQLSLQDIAAHLQPRPGLAADHAGQVLHLLRLHRQDDRAATQVLFELIVCSELSWKLMVQNERATLVELEAVKEGVPTNAISSLDHVDIILDKAELSVKPSAHPTAQSVSHDIDAAIVTLEKAVAAETEESEEPSDLTFLVEQLFLMRKPEAKGRRFSGIQLSVALLLRLHSKSGYERLRGLPAIMALPAISTLRRLTGKLTRNQESYLKARYDQLKHPNQRYCLLIHDEVAIKQGLELEGGSGKIVGLTDEGEPATKCLAFMIVSLCGPFRDVVRMIPTSGKLKGAQIAKLIEEVIADVFSSGFIVKAVVSDNLAANATAAKILLPPGETHFMHKKPEIGKVFVMFDYIHNAKNIYGNWFNRGHFHFPKVTVNLGIGDNMVDVSGSEAAVRCLEEIHRQEHTDGNQKLGTSYTLNSETFNPSNLQKTSTKYFNQVFSEKTAVVLMVLYQKNPDMGQFCHTAAFIRHILNLYEIQNVRTRNKGHRKRSQNMYPVTSIEDPKLAELEKGVAWFKEWAAMAKVDNSKGRTGLSTQTFTAMIQTLRAQVDLARHCIGELGFKYFLMGKTSSDPIERRFGIYRQACGGNYYISLLDALHAERSTKALTVARFMGSNMLNCSASEMESTAEELSDRVLVVAEKLEEKLEMVETPKITYLASQSLFYTAGYVANAEVNRNKCDDCAELLVHLHGADMALGLVEETEEERVAAEAFRAQAAAYTKMLSRGGLKEPSDLAIIIAKTCLSKWYQLRDSEKNWNTFFLTCTQENISHRRLFVSLATLSLEENTDVSPRLSCPRNHLIVSKMFCRFFNCFFRYLAHHQKDDAKLRANARAVKLNSASDVRHK